VRRDSLLTRVKITSPGFCAISSQDPLEMRFAAHHRPEMAQRLDIVELRQRGLGDILQRLAGGVGEKMEMEPHQEAVGESVENMTDSR
jgi:hypothetical protein